MKLYNVPNNTWILVDDQELFFHHVDGMYSYCTDRNGCVYHIAAYADVEYLQYDKQES